MGLEGERPEGAEGAHTLMGIEDKLGDQQEGVPGDLPGTRAGPSATCQP